MVFSFSVYSLTGFTGFGFLMHKVKSELRTMSDFYEEACYLSNSEAEPDSETEDSVAKPAVKPELAWDDPQALLNTWLGELDNLHMVSHETCCYLF